MNRKTRGWAMIVCAAGLVCAREAQGQWTIQNVSASGGSGFNIKTALDYTSGLHAGYYNGGNYDFVDRVGASWVPRQTYSAGAFDLNLSRRGQVGLGLEFPGIQFGERSAGAATWTPTTVATGTTAQAVSLDYDGANRAHLSYIDTAAHSLRYVHYTGAVWQNQTVVTNAAVGGPFYYGNSQGDLALDQQGSAYFTYFDFSTSTEMFAKPNGAGGWTSAAMTPAASGGYGRIVVDRQNVLHSVYTDYSNRVNYLTYNGTSWTSQLVETGIHGTSSLTFDAKNEPHVAYTIRPGVGAGTTPPDGVKHAFRVNGNWTSETITNWANTSEGAEESSIQVDRRGGIHVVYSDDSQTVKYASKAGQLGTISKAIVAALDAKATSNSGGPFGITDGGTFLTQFRNGSTEDRTVLEFNASQIPANASLFTAKLELDITGFASAGGQFSSIDLWGYSGNGVLEVADAGQLVRIGGWTGPVSAGGLITIDLDPALIQALRTAGNYVGLVATAGLDSFQSSFASTEYAQQVGTVHAPTLVVTYAPEPGGLALIAVGAAGMLARRRRVISA